MCLAVAYLATFLLALGAAAYYYLCADYVPNCLHKIKLPYFCAIAGGAGSVFYSLWAVYSHWSRQKNWDDDWLVWYLIRPILGLIAGVFTFILLKSGLILLTQQTPSGPASQNLSSNLAYLALAFLAGFNIEDVTKKFKELFKNFFNVPEKNPPTQK